MRPGSLASFAGSLTDCTPSFHLPGITAALRCFSSSDVEQLGRDLRLVVEDVVGRVAVRAVAVVERAAERRLLLRVAVAADGQVVAGEHERELLPLGRLAVDQRADVLEVAAGVELPLRLSCL